jgi:hypothetical protein
MAVINCLPADRARCRRSPQKIDESSIDRSIDRAAEEFTLELKFIAAQEPTGADGSGNGIANLRIL